ncbi:DUF805 domain-containing protein [Oceanobacillus halotolerans]|uniref:DUF805 domain-containing protein n=1 Tax=Oceanobacillus halotolerans TaxID=2663380 RepID=UPI0013D94230|nr:DUF805 domain-containing protein [Oceanobacillus halotolerans]
MEWYVKVLKNYVNFQGRARRTEYWMFTLFNLLAIILLTIIEAMIGLFGVLTFLYNIAILLPALAVQIRRLHDIGRSGWWILISFVPIAGGIILLVFMCLDSEPNDNQYGPNPKIELLD